MRNDYHNHPAGPLQHDPNPNQVLEIGKPKGSWIIAGIMAVLLIAGGLLVDAALDKIAVVRAKETGKPPVSQQTPVGIIMSFIGTGLLGICIYQVANNTIQIRIRPDGIEFPAQGLPPLRWDEIQEIDIATLNIIGGGGCRDYLGIRLQPGVLPGGNSPYSTKIMRAVRKAVDWNFDICIPQSDINLCPAHLSMEMRARHEAVQRSGMVPFPPEGLKELPSGPLSERS